MSRMQRKHLSSGTVARYSVGSLGTGGFATLPGLVLVYYLTDTLGVTAAVAGIAITVAKIWDVLIDPVIGDLSDRSFAKKGSRRGPMLLGAFLLPIFFTLTFAAPQSLSASMAAVWVTIAFLLAATAFSIFQVPFIALPAEIAGTYDDRTRLLTWRVVVLTFAILLFGAGGPELRGLFPDDPARGYLIMGIVAGVTIGIGFFVASFTAPKQVPTGVIPKFNISRSYKESLEAIRASQPFRALLGAFMLQALATGLMLAGAQFVARWVLDDERAVTILFVSLIGPALLVTPVWQIVAKRIGKERGFVYASVIYMLATVVLTGMVFAPGWWIMAPVAVAGAAYAGMQSLALAMLADVINIDADKHNKDRAGIFSGTWTAGETTGMAFGATLLTIILTLTGYLEKTGTEQVVQQASAVTGISLSFSLVPAVLMFLSLIVFKRYRLRRSDFESETQKA